MHNDIRGGNSFCYLIGLGQPLGDCFNPTLASPSSTNRRIYLLPNEINLLRSALKDTPYE